MKFLSKKIQKTPLDLLEINNKYDIIIQTKGGGNKGQAEAIICLQNYNHYMYF